MPSKPAAHAATAAKGHSVSNVNADCAVPTRAKEPMVAPRLAKYSGRTHPLSIEPIMNERNSMPLAAAIKVAGALGSTGVNLSTAVVQMPSLAAPATRLAADGPR
jgi:hypothetical protein